MKAMERIKILIVEDESLVARELGMPEKGKRPRRDLNPCCRLERAMS